jgi:hypothetical protein
MEPEIALVADLNSEDDDGLGWSSLRRWGGHGTALGRRPCRASAGLRRVVDTALAHVG